MKHILLFIALIILSVSNTFAQGWTYQGNFPNDDFKGAFGLQGLAVDPDGKVWITKLSPEYFTPPGLSDSILVRLIYVFNPDGTPALFSPIWKIDGPGFADTLFGSNNRGLRTDQNGNILYVTGGQAMYRINYQTGQGMNKVDLGLGITPTAPGVSEDGKIFVGPVINGGYSIKEFDTDFNFVSNAVTFNLNGFSRTLEVYMGGNTIYFPIFSRNLIIVYNRPDEFSAFDSVGTIMDGVACESITLNRSTDKLWVAGGSYMSPPISFAYTPNTWYEYDILSGVVTDSINWQMNFPNNPDERPRAIDFSPDGRFAYVGCFGSSDYPIVQKFEAPILPVELTSFNIIISDNNNIILNWSTATEINNLGFEIQRIIKNSEWIPITFKPGKGTTTEKQFYSYTDICDNLNNEKILYRLKQIDLNGDFVFSETKEIVLSNTNVPKEFFLSQNFPNPFNPSTKISWQSPVSGWQTLKVYDLLGNEVATLVNEEKPAGNYEVEFDASNLSSGVYYYQLRSGNFVETMKMILLR